MDDVATLYLKVGSNYIYKHRNKKLFTQHQKLLAIVRVGRESSYLWHFAKEGAVVNGCSGQLDSVAVYTHTARKWQVGNEVTFLWWTEMQDFSVQL